MRLLPYAVGVLVLLVRPESRHDRRLLGGMTAATAGLALLMAVVG